MISPAKGFMRDEVTDERRDFQFNPEELELVLGAEWTAVSPRGSSHPRQSYKHSKGRSFSLTLKFLRETVDASDIEQRQRWIESLPFADYDRSGRLLRAPHTQHVVFGAWRSLRCTIEEVRVAMKDVWWDPETLRPGEFTATVTFSEVPPEGDIGRADVLAGA